MNPSNLPPGCSSPDGGIDHEYEAAVEALVDAAPRADILHVLKEIAPIIQRVLDYEYGRGYNDGRDDTLVSV